MLSINRITTQNLKSGKLKDALPEFYELKSVIENNSGHYNESTFNHTLKVLANYQKYLENCNPRISKYLNQKVDKYKRKDLLFLAIVFHDLGKKETMVMEGDKSSFSGHEKVSVSKARKILKRFDLSVNESDIVLGAIKKHSDLHRIVKLDNEKLDTQFKRLRRTTAGYITELVILVFMDILNGYSKKTKPEKYKFAIDFYKGKLK